MTFFLLKLFVYSSYDFVFIWPPVNFSCVNEWLIYWLIRTFSRILLHLGYQFDFFSFDSDLIIASFCISCAFYLLSLNEFLCWTLTVLTETAVVCFLVLLALSSLSIKLLTDHFTQLNEKQLRLVQIKYLKLFKNIDLY